MDAAGRPLRDCEVQVWRTDVSGGPPLTVRTGVQGEFAFELADAATGWLLVHDRPDPEGAVWSASAPISEAAEPKLVLARGHLLYGRVLEDGGAVLGSARVVVGRYPGMTTSEDAGEVQSDDSGAFALAGCPPGRWHLLASLADPIRAWRVLSIHVPASHEIVFAFPRYGRVGGLVLDPDGRPVSGAYVSIQVTSDGEFKVGTGAQTAQDGRFDSDRVEAGTVGLTARLPGFASSTTHVGELDSGGEILGVELRLRRAARISITNLDERGRRTIGGVVDYELLVAPPDGFLFRWGSFPFGEVELGVSGEGTLVDLPPGLYWLRCKAQESEAFVELEPGATETITLGGSAPTVPLAIEGRLREGGSPASGFGMSMHIPGTGDRRGSSCITGADGSFRFATNARVRQQIRVRSKDGGAVWSTDVDASRTMELPLVLDLPTGSIRGEVLLPDGLRVPQCSLRLVPLESPPPSAPLHLERSESTAIGGTFQFSYLPAGRYRLIASRPDDPRDGRASWLRAQAEVVVPTEGEQVQDVRLVLAPE